MKRKYRWFATITAVYLLACDILQPPITPPPLPPPTEGPPTLPVINTPAATKEAAPTLTDAQPPATRAPGTGQDAQEAILILEPGPGSRVTSPLRLSGEADPTFEQSLAVTVFLEDGTELLTAPVQIQSETGQRGPFVVEIPFSIEGERQALVQVYASSARDGGVTHLSSVWVRLAPSGEEAIRSAVPSSERIVIHAPVQGEVLRGGIVHVEGFGQASFEQTLVVEVIDPDGNVIGTQPVIVESPEMGQPARFQADVSYSQVGPGQGRVVVRDESPAFGGNVHLSSVEVKLE